MPHLPTLLAQLIVVLVAARACGWLARRLGQPQVVGEMAAGIALGPSLLGALAPGLAGALFPADGLGGLYALSQVGLLLFMFLVGLEFDPHMLRGQAHAAVLTSHASIVVPFALGALLATWLYGHHAPAGVPFAHFALFLGTAMSITAFPVLARILGETGLLHTRVGALTIACAAVDDVTAWCILAGVVALVRATGAASLALSLAGAAVYVAAMLLLARPLLARFLLAEARKSQVLGVGLLAVLVSAYLSELVGLHALFGAFLAGVVLPKGLAAPLRVQVEGVTLALLLPLFFAFTGLRTQIGLLSSAGLWLECAAIVAVAVAGKFGGATLAARASRLGWREASAVGVLMNTRGLMELVVLHIGLEIGVIGPALFTMMVLMALLTTAMTTPLLERFYLARRRGGEHGASAEPALQYKGRSAPK